MSEHILMAVDISHHNVLVRDGVVESDVVGVFHKATEGETFIDDMYDKRRKQAEELGLKWASYHFLRPGDIGAQMDFYLSVVEPDDGERVCIDYEDSDLNLGDLREAVEAIQRLNPSLQITVYGGALLKEQLGDDYDEVLAGTSLWIAQYTSAEAPEWPKGTWPMWSLWQYSDGSVGGYPRSVPGIDGTYDCNAFNGSAENCAKWFGPADASDLPVIEANTVYVDISAPEGIEVVVTVNQRPF